MTTAGHVDRRAVRRPDRQSNIRGRGGRYSDDGRLDFRRQVVDGRTTSTANDSNEI